MRVVPTNTSRMTVISPRNTRTSSFSCCALNLHTDYLLVQTCSECISSAKKVLFQDHMFHSCPHHHLFWGPILDPCFSGGKRGKHSLYKVPVEEELPALHAGPAGVRSPGSGHPQQPVNLLLGCLSSALHIYLSIAMMKRGGSTPPLQDINMTKATNS